MSILHRYILKELFSYFLMLFTIFLVILLAKETYDTRDEILEDNPAAMDVIEYVVMTIPNQVLEWVPLVTMFSALFALGLMAKNRELMAMVAAGIPFFYLAVPVALFGLTTTLLSFLVGNYIAPDAQSRAKYLLEVKIKGESQYSFFGNNEIFRKGEGDRFYVMANFDSTEKVMTHPTILVKNEQGDGLRERLEASRARLVNDNGDEVWEFENLQRWTFNEDGSVASVDTFDVPFRMTLEDKLGEFLSPEQKIEEMSLGELRDFGAIVQRQGGTSQAARYRTALHDKLALPLGCMLLSMIGFAVAADLHVRRFVLAFTFGLIFGILFYVLREALRGMGLSGFSPPPIAGWGPVIVFTLILIGLMRRLHTVR